MSNVSKEWRPERVSLSDPWVAEVATTMMRAGQAHGDIPRDRPPLTGDEDAFVLFVGPMPIGIAIFYQPEGHDLLWLDVLYVRERSRRCGAARVLVGAVIGAAREADVSRVEFGTICGNSAMQNVGKKLGFEPVAVTMRLPLGTGNAA